MITPMKLGAVSTMDSAGRLVLPREIRDQAQLEPGMPLRIVFRDGRVEIDPAPRKEPLFRKAWTFLGDCVASATAGGRVYDAVIASAAIEAHARELLTFNPRDFEMFSDRIAIIVP